ncbi:MULTISPECIES: hypothetical protein [Heyndrickxia]|uniref:Helix-turn-helix family protein n=1 Tax=Heyndrickxia coagulans DSM 1 = ATCC 7050 TaxID=1121088 RepID=A0A0B5X361_HEYCO|nr:hypothetical protein [Heyndrickxia coagulans]AJH78612.1 hypothetical protein BF29_2495 [Heyndrickxia coagulans DSM 1 = ATCC 7050]AJH79000.1 hypothetical protein BF29_2571 [Heyndrickxia coagulans DSM 1 = ATCC 7050]AWP37805.1 hypothetical protein CYJ15_12845 [Heyndrickxia coagulans]MCR2847349.1 hypothetical protein [Heyndrickxia coagulans]MDR4225173.1 hypothetical protein [Heyndrickxia coagulans DSM 1 = ATCC 7050]
MRESAKVQEALAILQQDGLTQKQIAKDTYQSYESVNKQRKGERTMNKDVAHRAMQIYQNYEFEASILHEFSDGLASPVMGGPYVERHRMVLEEITEAEVKDVIRIINEVSLVKPPNVCSKDERENVRRMMHELIEARVAIDNLLMVLERDYGLSVLEESKKVLKKLRSERRV